jgi:hypothetical protein
LINVKQNAEYSFVKGIEKFHSVSLLKFAISGGFQPTATPLHSTSGTTNPATYCDKRGLYHQEEVNCKTKAHGSGIVYCIRQEALPVRLAG